MWNKLIIALLKFYFFITPKDKSEYINYHILSQEEFNLKGDEFILKEIIYSEHVESVKGLQNKIPTTNHQVLRKPYFVCASRKNHFIRDLKTKAYIGKKNFPMFDKIKSQNDDYANEISGFKHELNLQNKELKAKLKLLSFIKNELSEITYNKIVFKHEQMESSRSI